MLIADGNWEERLADRKLDRADRATALKFLVHFVGDLHQPFHAIGVARGGNDVQVRVFGESDCGPSASRGAALSLSKGAPASAPKPSPCNLHSVWDSRLIGRRNIDDREYVAALRKLMVEKRWGSEPAGTPAQWAEQSWQLAKAALVQPDTNIDEDYYRRHIRVIDERMALGGVRLAATLNRILTLRCVDGRQEAAVELAQGRRRLDMTQQRT